MCDQFFRRRHVNPVHIGKAHGRCCGGEEHLIGTGFAGHLDDLTAGGATHDGIIHQQHIAIAKLQLDRVEFAPHAAYALGLAGHDESAPNVAVFNKTLAIIHA